MRHVLPALLFGLLAVAMNGCSPSAKTASEKAIARGKEKLTQAREKERIEDVDEGDYTEMTQVEPNLKKKAMADFDKAIEDDPNNADAYYARGFAFLSHGDAMLKAVADFNKAIELNPKYASAYLMRGRAYEALGEMDKAKADRAKALELEPSLKSR